MSTSSNSSTSTSTAEASPTPLTALPSSLLLANLIPSVLAAVYVLLTVYKLRSFIQSCFRSPVWSSLWRKTYPRNGLSAEDGYMEFRETSDDDDDGDDDAADGQDTNFVIGYESEEDEVSEENNTPDAANVTTPLTARSAMSQRGSMRKENKQKVRIQEEEERPPTPKSGSSWRLSTTLRHPDEQRGLYTPLRQIAERDDNDGDTLSVDAYHDNDNDREDRYGLSKFFDRRTSRLKRVVLVDPETKIDGLNENVRRPGFGTGSASEWGDWLVDRIVQTTIRCTVGVMEVG